MNIEQNVSSKLKRKRRQNSNQRSKRKKTSETWEHITIRNDERDTVIYFIFRFLFKDSF